MEAQLDKMWRTVFNAGSTPTHLMKMVPEIVKETVAFCDILQELVENEDLFQMTEAIDNLALDVIGKVVL